MSQILKGSEATAKRLDLILRKMGSYCGVLYSSCRVPERETGMVDMETSRIGRFAGGNEVVCSYYFYFPNEI